MRRLQDESTQTPDSFDIYAKELGSPSLVFEVPMSFSSLRREFCRMAGTFINTFDTASENPLE
jgi:hypothetical protein